MLIRSQFSSETLGRLILQRITSIERPCPRVLYEIKAIPGTTVLIKQVGMNGLPVFGVGDNTTVAYPNIAPPTATLSRSRINATVPLRLLLEADGPGASLVPSTLNVNVSTALEFTMAGNSDLINITLLGTDQDSLLGLMGVDASQVADALGIHSFPLNVLSNTTSLLSGDAGFSLRHADVALNPQTSRIEFRLELMLDGIPDINAQAGWALFYAGGFDSIAASQGWGVLVDQQIGTRLLRNKVRDQIDSVNKFNRDGDPNVSWDSQFPGYHISINGEAVDACRCLWGLIDVDVRINLDVKLSIEGGVFRIDLWVSHKITDDLAVICCAITAALFFPIVGLEALVKGQIAWYDTLEGCSFQIRYFCLLPLLPKCPKLIPASQLWLRLVTIQATRITYLHMCPCRRSI